MGEKEKLKLATPMNTRVTINKRNMKRSSAFTVLCCGMTGCTTLFMHKVIIIIIKKMTYRQQGAICTEIHYKWRAQKS